MKFRYKNNIYKLMADGNYCIRSHANVDGTGYSWYNVTDNNMIEILNNYLKEKEKSDGC